MNIKKTQKYHLESNKGLLNDPNGLVYFKNKYYIFFQWNRFEKSHNYKEWGLFTTVDFKNWNFRGSTIIPDQEYDLDGVYSGSAYVIDDKLYIYYTGNRKKNGIRKSSQCLVITEDGKKFEKKGIILETPEEYTEHFRDPKVFKYNGNFYMVIGAQLKNGKGGVALAKSKDGIMWTYLRNIAKTEEYEMIECPDFIELGNKILFLYNPQKRDNELDTPLFSFSSYKILDKFFLENDSLDLEAGKLLDYGFDFYAPQTFKNFDGRIIMYAWMSRMSNEEEKKFASNEKNIHCLTLPRELKIKNKKLYQIPVNELYSILGKEIFPIIKDKAINIISDISTIYFKIEDVQHIENELKIDFKNLDLKFTYKLADNKIELTRKNWVTKNYETKAYFLDKIINLEVWIDVSSVEIFINNGKMVFSSRVYPKTKKRRIDIIGIKKYRNIEIKEIVGGKRYE